MTNPSVPCIAQTFKAGDKLAGCYTLKETLPSQGFCVVWLAHDEELNKDIVLHFVPDSVASDSRAMSELKQEAKRNRQLIHPRIVRVHDLVEDEKWAAISMDYVPGETLASLQTKREKNACNSSELAAGITELCQTIEDAHRIDLFHRDLTPENIVATANGLMVQKFGISRVILDALARSGQSIPASRDIAYISPQQLDGERPNRGDDIYSLGATLFDLLTGAPPFTEGDIIPQIRKTVPPVVSERRAALGISAEPIPKAWDDTIAACLAKTVEERPKSAAEAGSRFASGKPGAAGPAAAPAGSAPKSPVEAKDAPKSTPSDQEPASKQQKRPWSPSSGKTPVIAEATILSKTAVPKGDTKAAEAKGEAPKESAPAKPAEPAAAPGGAKKPGAGGPTTPTGFPLRAFVEVEGDQKRPKSRSSAGLVAAGVVLILILIVGYLVAKNNGGNEPENAVATTGTSSETPAGTSESTTPPTPVEAASPASTPTSQPVNLASTSPAPTPASTPAPEAAPSAPPSVAESPASAPVPAASAIPAGALAAMTDAQVDQLVADKTKAVDQAKAALADAEKAAQDKAAAQAQAASAVQDLQAAIKQKSSAAADAKKAVDATATALKQQQDALQKAQADADAAQKAAAAKAQAADQIRKTVQDAQAAVEQQQTALQQALTASDQLAKSAADRQQAADAAAKAAADAEKGRLQRVQALSQAQADLGQVQTSLTQARSAEKARAAAAEADRVRKAREAAAAQAQVQVAAAAKAAADAQKALDAARKAVADAEKAQADAERQAEAAKNGTLPASTPAPLPETTAPAATPPSGAAASPASNESAPSISVRAPNPHLKVDQALSNSLGMRFAPVGTVFFSIWLTRVQDFETFALATGYKGSGWQDPGFKQAPDHPVVNVSWNDANQFCLWLTEKEHHDGILSANQTYRLPTDLEWSNAVGLPPETGHTPESRDMDVPDVYPWGTQWPPPAGAGNYTGEETDSDVAIKGYNDGFAWTSPVGSFNANRFGLYDMGGNVWEWCEDWWNSEQKAKVLRGGSWYNGALKLSLLSSCRIHASADQGTDNYGFRIVLAPEPTKPRHHAQ